ncbi:DUF1589 domain-containing protein [Rhodopirellula baltica]|uniref:DUF1589 domain-containing protein n=1 Tax=Rhodopirellula baltica TaxID=265606 RepID=UPI00118181F7
MRRPGSTWQPRQCFGTKRGVCTIARGIDVETQSASHHRQVEPGLRALGWNL